MFKYRFKNQVMYFNSKIERVMKQETLEEAAIKYATETNGVIINQRKKQQFIAGAKYQAERMYSEEEVLCMLLNNPYQFEDNIKEWFEQFKKK